MPGVPLYKFYAFDRNGAPSRTFQPQNVFWAVREAKDDGWGVGILPLIEILGNIQEQLVPSQADLEKEMVEMLRSFSPASQLGDPGAAAECLLAKERPTVPEVKPTWLWPKYKPAAQSSAPPPVTSTPGKARRLQSGSAKASPRVTDFGKYSPAHGLMKANRLDSSIPENIRITLADNINSSLAYQTWRSVRSVKRRVEECEVQTGTNMSIPWNQRKLATFTGWCLQRGLRSQTVENYLSKVREETPSTRSSKCFSHLQVRKLHELEEFPFPSGRMAGMVKKALTGRGNTQEVRPSRLAITPDVLYLIKTKLAKAKIPLTKKRLIWAVASILFIGSLRVGEILAPSAAIYVRGNSLLNKHVEHLTRMVGGEERNFLKLFLESPKEDKARKGVHVELFSLGNFFCPVEAYTKWKLCSKVTHGPEDPVFRREDGLCYTAKEFNADLKRLLESEIDYSNGRISSHSFRAGITTTMARLGYSKVRNKLEQTETNKISLAGDDRPPGAMEI